MMMNHLVNKSLSRHRSFSLLQWKLQVQNKRQIHAAINKLSRDNAKNISLELQTDGFVATPSPFLSIEDCTKIKNEYDKLFRGDFETGIYPDEWHYRKGISLENVTREICNAWKSSSLIASVVLNQDIGRFISQLMGWESVRLAQDDVIWKVPFQNKEIVEDHGVDTVGYHQDSAYISTQFEPYENSVTVWFALDDVYEGSGGLEYATASHNWPVQHRQQQEIYTNEDNNSTSPDTSQSFHSSDASSYHNPLKDAASDVGIEDNNLEKIIKRVPVRMGHAIIHHQDVWHGSGPNTSQNHRRALVAHYLKGDVRFRSNSCEGKSVRLFEFKYLEQTICQFLLIIQCLYRYKNS